MNKILNIILFILNINIFPITLFYYTFYFSANYSLLTTKSQLLHLQLILRHQTWNDQIPGTSVMFTVEASAECGDSVTYQWSFGETSELSSGDGKYEGFNTNQLTINNLVHPTDEGTYTVDVTNEAGTTSASATLDIGTV